MFRRAARYRHPMAYTLALIGLALVVGGIGNANHNDAISELATVALIVGLILLGRALWQRRHNQQRDSR